MSWTQCRGSAIDFVGDNLRGCQIVYQNWLSDIDACKAITSGDGPDFVAFLLNKSTVAIVPSYSAVIVLRPTPSMSIESVNNDDVLKRARSIVSMDLCGSATDSMMQAVSRMADVALYFYSRHRSNDK